MNQKGGDKWEKVRSMYREVCLDDEITDDFIMFHDDFFMMKPIDKIEPIYRDSFESHIKAIEDKFGERKHYENNDLMREYKKHHSI